jgi:hypothetical protein
MGKTIMEQWNFDKQRCGQLDVPFLYMKHNPVEILAFDQHIKQKNASTDLFYNADNCCSPLTKGYPSQSRRLLRCRATLILFFERRTVEPTKYGIDELGPEFMSLPAVSIQVTPRDPFARYKNIKNNPNHPEGFGLGC